MLFFSSFGFLIPCYLAFKYGLFWLAWCYFTVFITSTVLWYNHKERSLRQIVDKICAKSLGVYVFCLMIQYRLFDTLIVPTFGVILYFTSYYLKHNYNLIQLAIKIHFVFHILVIIGLIDFTHKYHEKIENN